eukprot:FR743909.1.p1 GENE.FR743909.1~~FR743909.1.p1  ORF type:complete len:332 (+),score=59.53 FR743909.1:54-998(+)
MMLQAAVIQRRIFDALSERGTVDRAVLDELGHGQLLSQSELYNDFARAYDLWQICLVIMEKCNHNDREEIAQLWHRIILQELPEAVTPEAQHQLGRKRHDWNVGPVTKEGKFEDGGWISGLRDKIVSIGKEVYSGSSQYVFPVRLLCSELEQITAALSRATGYSTTDLTESWVAGALHDAGVPYDDLFETYAVLVNMVDQSHEQSQPQVLMAFTRLLETWAIRTIKGGDAREVKIFGLRCSPDQISSAKNRLLALRGHSRPELVHRCIEKLEDIEGPGPRQVLAKLEQDRWLQRKITFRGAEPRGGSRLQKLWN